MSGIWNRNIGLSIFGESHGEAIGITINGLVSGHELDLDFISSEMARRAPGGDEFSTTRKEKDAFNIISGVFNGRTTGAPLCMIIENTDTRSKDYDSSLLRPGHADYTAKVKYNGFNDNRGGGHFSGRLTAGLVFAGAICKDILRRRDIKIAAHIRSIGNIYDDCFDLANIPIELMDRLLMSSFPSINDEAAILMQQCILKAKSELDSVGGVIECAAVGVPTGLGDPFFGSVESILSSLLFSVPAVKGVEFGSGFAISELEGSVANDEIFIKDGNIATRTNHNGGINGGITNGMPLVFSAAFKPTPSIARTQHSVNPDTMEQVEINIKGRHDPCIVKRAVVVVESVCAIALLDLMGGRMSE